MTTRFDEAINREGTNSVKWDLRKDTFGRDDIIPMWVADMDFPTPEFITDAVKKRADHQVLGYTFRGDEYFNSIISWLHRRHHWKVDREWIVFCPGVVPALNAATLAFTNPGDSIIIQPPVYPPFFNAVTAHGQKTDLQYSYPIQGKIYDRLRRIAQLYYPRYKNAYPVAPP